MRDDAIQVYYKSPFKNLCLTYFFRFEICYILLSIFHSNYIIHEETYYILSYTAVIAISSYESLKENFVSGEIIDSLNETRPKPEQLTTKGKWPVCAIR